MIMMTDPATFYMDGKAWANGLVPYADFIDVKGPLLMFIYTVGWLLSPGGPEGIFAIYCLALSVTLFIFYRTARLFVPSFPLSILTALLAVFVVFREEPLVSGEQAEMLMLPLVSWLAYSIIKLENQERLIPSDWFKAALSIGVGGAACLLIKFNVAIPYAFAAMGCLGTLVVRKAPLSLQLRFWSILFGSGLLVVLPFVAYMWHTDSLRACFDSYLILNLMTYSSGSEFSFGSMVAQSVGDKILFAGAHLKWTWPALVGMFCLLMPPFSRYGAGKARIPWVTMLVAAGVYACSHGYHECYYIMPSALSVFFMIPVARAFLYPAACPTILAYAAILLALGLSSISGKKLRSHIKKMHESPQVQALESLIETKPGGAKILYLDSLELGFGMKNALPACPMWVLHNRAPLWAQGMQQEAIRQRAADYVLFYEKRSMTEPEKDRSLLEASGYERVYGVIEGERQLEGYSLWRKGEPLEAAR